jgi:CheY-like chemotaxis protein
MTAAKTTILVADDDQIARELLAAHLSVMGFALVFAEDGQAALETAREVVPDIILLDVMMPKMTGFEVCAAIRQDPQLKQIPILMITTLDDRDSRLAG